MKTVSIWQPWASLVASGHKTIETRSWPVPEKLIGRRVGIHAASTRVLAKYVPLMSVEEIKALPARALLGTVKILGCVATSSPGALGRINNHAGFYGPVYDESYELILGDYGPNRFAWLLAHPEVLPEPYAMPGAQRFFDVDDDLFAGTIPSWHLAD